MAPASSRAQTPLLAYVDTNILVYWLLPSSHNPKPRSQASHLLSRQETMRLFAIFRRHAGPSHRITVVTCQWGLTETHGALYADALWQNGAFPRRHKQNPRRRFPPHHPSLQQATTALQAGIGSLVSTVALQIEQPDSALWETAQQISEECGIYAPDCLHLAAALHSGCGLFVTYDIDLLNKIHHLQQTGNLGSILASLFPGGMAPQFDACPLRSSSRLQQSQPIARSFLAQMGYT